jgi:DNA polymerase-3 subunit chi
MAEIQFHTLSVAGGTHRYRHACRLIEQAYLDGQRVLVWLEPGELAQLDQLLWTFGDRAFVPHEPLAPEPRASDSPVQLHDGETLGTFVLEGGFHTLVNLRAQPAAEVLRFASVIEVIDADPAVRDAGRARFRFYREAGSNPRHVAVTNDE